MCFQVKKIEHKGERKESSYKGSKGETYKVETWQKCGYCEECLAEKANNWVVRAWNESKGEKDICFLTLTYKTTPKYLVKKDLQDWLKRFRKTISPARIRFMACGQYGTLRQRPHFHILVWGWRENTEKLSLWKKNKKGNACFKSETVEKTWGKGWTTYQIFDAKEIPYIALYTSTNILNKQQVLAKKEELLKKASGLNDGQKKEQALMRLSKIKGKWVNVKEFITSSIALGFDKWFSAEKSNAECWQEYFLEMEIMTPTPWLKKLAAYGLTTAFKELKKREEYAKAREEKVDERKTKKMEKLKKLQEKKSIELIEKLKLIEDCF